MLPAATHLTNPLGPPHVESKSIPEGVAKIDVETLRKVDESTRVRVTGNDLMKHEGLTLGEAILRGRVNYSPFLAVCRKLGT